MRLSLIVAMARNRVIGRDNALPWHLPADLKRFKALTLGHTLIMGRKTYESIGRPLPGRTTIVVTRNPAFRPEGVRTAPSVDAALAQAAGEEVFIAGGAELYAQTVDRADRLYLTVIDRDEEGDVRLPEIDLTRFRLVARERGQTAELSYEFLTYDRQP